MYETLFSLKWLVGDPVTTVALDAQTDTWSLSFSSRSTISIPCLWRLLRNGAPSCTSRDHNCKFGLPAPLDALAALRELEGQAVQLVAVRSGTSALTLSFNAGLSLEIINTSSGFEGWDARHPSLGAVFVMGSGELSAIPGA